MAELFGSPLGHIASDQNYRQNLLAAMQSEETAGRIAMQPLQQRKAQAEVETLETALQQEKAFAGLLAQGPDAAPEGAAPASVADQIGRLAERAAGAGLVKKAGELAKVSAEIRSKEQATRTSQIAGQLNQLRLVREDAELTGQILGSATSPESWEQANAIYELQTGRKSPYAGLPYNPEVVKRINEVSLSTKERADLDERRLRREELEEGRRQAAADRRLTRDLMARRVELAEDRENRLAKAGGGTGSNAAPGPANQEERREVLRQIRQSGVDLSGINADSANSVAFSIASRARAIQQSNRAIDRSQAINQAMEEARRNGELEVLEEGGRNLPLIGRVGGEKRFAGKTPKSKPIVTALPPNRSELKTGTIYQTSRGPARYLGNGRFSSVEE